MTKGASTLANTTKVQQAKQVLTKENVALKMSEILRVLADPTRIKLISAISNDELCVCEIALALELSQSLVSHQLRALRILGLVNLRSDGRNNYYSVNNSGLLKILEECRKMI